CTSVALAAGYDRIRTGSYIISKFSSCYLRVSKIGNLEVEVTSLQRSGDNIRCPSAGARAKYLCDKIADNCEWMSGDFVGLTEFRVCQAGALLEVNADRETSLFFPASDPNAKKCPDLPTENRQPKFKKYYQLESPNVSAPSELTVVTPPNREGAFIASGWDVELHSWSKAEYFNIKNVSIDYDTILCQNVLDWESTPSTEISYFPTYLRRGLGYLILNYYSCSSVRSGIMSCADKVQYVKNNQDTSTCNFEPTLKPRKYIEVIP
ncbi:MAG: hypothetical protein NTV34_13905, partial [Proteobacteria bacterium]|nr:hypothetical protein [Pseudomonadota bacterium]